MCDELMNNTEVNENNTHIINQKEINDESFNNAVALNNNKHSDPSWCLDENSQLLLDEIDINNVDMLQLSATEKLIFQAHTDVKIDTKCFSKLQNDEHNNTYNVSSLYRPQQTLQELTQFTENIVEIKNKTTNSTNTFSEVKKVFTESQRAYIEAKEASNFLRPDQSFLSNKCRFLFYF